MAYPLLGWTMRQCVDCTFYQNHWRGDHGSNRETLDPWDAAEQAPRIRPDGLIVDRPKLVSTAAPTSAVKADRQRRRASTVIEVAQEL